MRIEERRANACTLKVITAREPPTVVRAAVIPLLVTHLVKQLSQKHGKEIEVIAQDTMNALRRYPWPGNIRELRNVIERAVIITRGTKLRLLDNLDSSSLEPEQELATNAEAVAHSGESARERLSSRVSTI